MTTPVTVTPDPALELAHGILMDAFGRVREAVPAVVDGLSVGELLWRPDPSANSIAWLLWHLTRVQDDHLAHLAAEDQVWTGQGWSERFALPYDVSALGYGQRAEEVSAFVLSDPQLLVGYHEAVHDLTAGIVRAMSVEDFERVVDERWDPPVTAAVRLVSVVNDITQHLGQAAYVKGLVERRR